MSDVMEQSRDLLGASLFTLALTIACEAPTSADPLGLDTRADASAGDRGTLQAEPQDAVGSETLDAGEHFSTVEVSGGLEGSVDSGGSPDGTPSGGAERISDASTVVASHCTDLTPKDAVVAYRFVEAALPNTTTEEPVPGLYDLTEQAVYVVPGATMDGFEGCEQLVAREQEDPGRTTRRIEVQADGTFKMEVATDWSSGAFRRWLNFIQVDESGARLVVVPGSAQCDYLESPEEVVSSEGHAPATEPLDEGDPSGDKFYDGQFVAVRTAVTTLEGTACYLRLTYSMRN